MTDMLYRAVAIEIDKEAAAKRDFALAETALPVSLSSEYAVNRYDFWEGQRYLEVLNHAPESVDLERANQMGGLPFLDSHDARAQMGRITNLRVEGGRLKGDVRFSKRAEAQALRADILDGIKGEVSVGYSIDPNNIARAQGENDPVPTYRINRWTPLEGSSVAVPADPTVGVGRSRDADSLSVPAMYRKAEEARQRATPTLEIAVEQTPAATPAAPAPTSAPVVEARAGVADDYKALAEVAMTAKREKDLPRWIAEGKTADQARKEILESMAAELKAAQAGGPVVELTAKERKAYSVTRAIAALTAAAKPGGGYGTVNCFEAEVSQEIERQMQGVEGYEDHGGLKIPLLTKKRDLDAEMFERAGLDSATSTKGSELKFNVPGDFLPMLRNFQVCVAAGATTMTGLRGPVRFPNQNNVGTATWSAENPGSDVSDSNLLLQQISLDPKTLLSSTSYSRQLLAQAVIDVESLVRQDLALINAIALDLAALAGTGASNQPTGVLSTSGIGSVTLGSNGGTAAFGTFVDLETLVAQANADSLGSLGYITSPKIRAQAKKIVPLSNTVGLPVWTPSGYQALGDASLQGPSSRIAGQVNGFPAWSSQQSPDNLTKGTSTTICSAITFGAWSQLVIGDWGMFEIIVDPYRLKKQGMIEVTSFLMAGIAVKYAAAFAACKDAL